MFKFIKRLLALFSLNNDRVTVHKIEDLPNPNIKVHYWEQIQIPDTLNCIVNYGESTAKEHLDFGLKLEVDLKHKDSDIVVIIAEHKSRKLIVYIPLAVIALADPEYKAHILTREQYSKALDAAQANIEKQIALLNDMQTSIKKFLDTQ